MAGHQQSPSPGTGKSSSNSKRPPRPPLAQALKKAIETASSADDLDDGPTGQSPLRRPVQDKKKTHVLQ